MTSRVLRRLKRRMLAKQPANTQKIQARGEYCPAIRAKHPPRNTSQPPIVQVGSLPAKSGFRSA